MNDAVGYGHGKVILFGEHAVVYGHAALAAAIDRGVHVTATRASALSLRVPTWALDVRPSDDHPAARALQRLIDALGCGRPALALVGDAAIPAAAGLGSSAALAVATARAIVAAQDRAIGLAMTVDDDAIIDAANAAEMEFHRRPSGVDVALAAAGGVGLYRPGAGLAPLVIRPVPIVIGLSGEPRSTAAMVEQVRDATGGRADDPRLVALGGHAAAGAAELARGDLAAVGERMQAAHRALAELAVSTPSLDGLVATAIASGALGAKLTGAGGGGAVIALAPGREDAVLAAWRAAGFAGFLARCGV